MNEINNFFEKREKNLFNPDLYYHRIIQIHIGMNVFGFVDSKELMVNKISLGKVFLTVIALNILAKNTIIYSFFRSEEKPSLLASFWAYNNFLLKERHKNKFIKQIPKEEFLLDSILDC